jgi:hypothetical protein
MKPIIHPCNKENSIDNTRNDDPFPKLMPYNKLMSLVIGLYGYDDLFKQLCLWFVLCCLSLKVKE